ncbi:MAG: endonuclease V [Bacteroidia bacterium]
MITCLDVQYTPLIAAAAAVVFTNWSDSAPVNTYSLKSSEVQEYIPGKFYLRELPPLLAVLHSVREPLDFIIIDGYCYLSDDHTPGLGHFLYEKLIPPVPVIGVAKNKFGGMNTATEVLRGQSQKPLYITAIGMDVAPAAALIRNMHGVFRIPTLLKLVDQIARKTAWE